MDYMRFYTSLQATIASPKTSEVWRVVFFNTIKRDAGQTATPIV